MLLATLPYIRRRSSLLLVLLQSTSYSPICLCSIVFWIRHKHKQTRLIFCPFSFKLLFCLQWRSEELPARESRTRRGILFCPVVVQCFIFSAATFLPRGSQRTLKYEQNTVNWPTFGFLHSCSFSPSINIAPPLLLFSSLVQCDEVAWIYTMLLTSHSYFEKWQHGRKEKRRRGFRACVNCSLLFRRN